MSPPRRNYSSSLRRIALGERFSFGGKGGGGGGGDVDGRPGSSHATIATTTEFVSAPRPQLLAVSGRSKTMDHESDFGDCGVSVSGAGSGSRGGQIQGERRNAKTFLFE